MSDSAVTPSTNTVTVSGGGETNQSNDTASDMTPIVQVSPTTITTSVSALVNTYVYPYLFTVDGNFYYSSPQTFKWANGSHHTIAAISTTQASGGLYTFANWSDGGAISHTVTGNNAGGNFTANFQTQYYLTTFASPTVGGTVTPASGYYPAGGVVQLQATAAPGYGFTFWSDFLGKTLGINSAISVTMDQSLAIIANFDSIGRPALSGTITNKTGPSNARAWAITVTNTGTGVAVAQAAQVDGLKLTQTFGTPCTPAVKSPFPALVGNIAAAASATANITIDFTGCPLNARFQVDGRFSSNSGATTGTFTRYNEFQ